MQQQGDKLFASFMANTGGLNQSDSTFAIQDGQATGGYNYEYTMTGGIQKSLCPQKLNSVADAQLRTLGIGLRNTKSTVKSIIRAAGTKLQLTDLGGTFVSLSEDTAAAGTNFLAPGSLQPVVNSMFVTPSTDVLWMAGGGMGSIYGVYSDSKVTANGTPAPTGSFTATEASGSGAWAAPGVYYYAIAFRKAATRAFSNAALDVAFTLTNVANTARLDFSSLTNLDRTKYDRIELYRSTLSGVSAFTAGDLVAEIDVTAAGYTGIYIDTGASLASAQIIPRAGNVLLDNSPLPAGIYKTICTWKRRLVVTNGSTVYISDINKPESWPLTNTIVVPSGGELTAVAIASFTPDAASTDEFLGLFKEAELWVLTGSTYTDWSLKFVDSAGTLGQASVVTASGYLYFLDNRGIYIWDGAGKPIYISRPIENLWGTDGKLDRSKLYMASAVFFKRQNQIVWFLSHNDIGEQKLLIKLDLRLTLPEVKGPLVGRMIDGKFLFGKVASPVYASSCFIFPTSSNQEQVLVTGDGAGFCYRQFYSTAGTGADDYDATYVTKDLEFLSPNITKQFYEVVVWVDALGNWPLTLDYWTDFRSQEADKHSVPLTINNNTGPSTALWDVGQWDVAQWDGYASRPKRLVYNLSAAPFNNNQGQVLKLRFRNQNSNEPFTIFGFGVSYSNMGTRT